MKELPAKEPWMETFLVVMLPALLGAIAMAGIAVGTRFIMKSEKITTLQFLTIWYACTTLLFTIIYIALWGFTIPRVLPGFWTAVLCGTTINIFIQFFNAKASSYSAGEVSLTKPIQSMTPGLITIMGLASGEWPGMFGWLGVSAMITGTWILFSKPDAPIYIPFQRLAYSAKILARWIKWRRGQGEAVPQEELDTTIVVTLALLSACSGTIGIFFDGLFTRRGASLQGILLGAMTFTALFTVTYRIWYTLSPDHTRPEHDTIGFRLFGEKKYAAALFGITVAWVLHILLFNPIYNETYLAYVGTLKRLSIPFGVIAGFYLFREKEFPKRMKAALFIALGAILIGRDDFVHRISRRLEKFVEGFMPRTI